MSVFISGQELTTVDNERMLGVTINNDLWWAEHAKGVGLHEMAASAYFGD